MKSGTLYELFIEELKEVYNSERQSYDLCLRLIQLATYPALQHALKIHLEEMQEHVKRIETIFGTLNADVTETVCPAMQGMVEEANHLLQDRDKSHVLDAAMISIAQKMMHYKIASYGVLRSFADQLDFDSAVIELLQMTLYDEVAADKKFTKIAEGSFFSNGVNSEAAEESEVGP